MKRISTLGILLLFTLLLAGCSREALMDRGAGLLDEIFAGDNVAPIVSTDSPDADPDPEPATEPEQPDPSAQEAEEPEIIDAAKPVVPDYSSAPSSTAPEQPKTVEPTSSSNTSSITSSGDVTPSHTDVTFFSAGESFRYLPQGITGTYACEYSSGNDAVASVNSTTGNVTAVGPGTTKIKMHVEYNGQYDFECIVRCNWEEEKQTGSSSGSTSSSSSSKNDEPVLPPTSSEPPASTPSTSTPSTPSAGVITASHSDATFFNPKESFRFLPQGAEDDCTVSYTTSNANVASVDNKTGTVTAVGPGTATVTMTVDCGGTEYIFKCIVRCNW